MSELPVLYDIQAQFCRVIANPRRLQIITLLDNNEMNVGDLAEQIGISIANVSQHLRILRDNHIVKTRRSAQVIYYSLTDSRLPKTCRAIRTILLDGMKKRGEIVNKLNEV